jgi:EAL and modified HD-GYP domain-containing signal transduction protein
LLAEKIETYEQYHHALDIGCEYFQGYFFSKPEVIKTVAFTPSQLSVINLMTEASKAAPDITAIVSIFESDVNLSFKLLRYSQSPIFKRAVVIETIKQAVVVLGMQELKRFVSLLFSAQFSQNKPQELTVMALVRARFCELVDQNVSPSDSESSGFLTGLLSLLDAMVDGDIKELMDKLPLSLEMKQAIVNRVGKFADILKLCELFENAEWDKIDPHCQTVCVDSTQAAALFQQSMNWSSARIKALHP